MLLEALVAIVIFSLVGLAILNLTNTVADGSAKVRNSLCGSWVVKNQIALLTIIDLPEQKIITEGDSYMCDALWHWKIKQQKINDPRVKLYSVDVYRNGEKIAQQQTILPAG